MNTKKTFETIRTPLEAFFCSRALIVLLLVLSSQLELQTVPAREGVNYESFISLESKNIRESLAKVFLSADASWYVEIARDGYHPGPLTTETPKNWTFFPLYPLLLKAIAPLFNSYLIAGLIISNSCFLLALIVLQLFMRHEKIDPATSDRAIWLCCFFPTSYFFISPLTESLFLLLSLGAFYFLRKERLIFSAVTLSLATATRPTGLMLLPAFLLELCKSKASTVIKLTSLAIAPLGAMFYMLYLHTLTGSLLAFSENQAAWGRFKGSFWELTASLMLNLDRVMIGWNFLAFNAFCALLALSISYYLYRRKMFSLALFLGIPVACALATGSVLSMARFVAALFPIYLGIALMCRSIKAERLVFIIAALFLSAYCIMYGTHITAGMA